MGSTIRPGGSALVASSIMLCLATVTACGDDGGGGSGADSGTSSDGSGTDDSGTDGSGETGMDTSSTGGLDEESSGSTGEPPEVGVVVDCWTTAYESAEADCRRIAVPIDRDDPERGELEVGVVRLPATGGGGGLPLLMLVGGPGPSGTLEATGVFFEGGPFEVARAEHEVIVIDYRGVGLSEPIASCAPPASPDGAAACGDAIADVGLLPDDITSARFADDVDAVLGLLEIPQVIAWGGSYGTRMGLTLMRDYPERIAASVIDGVFPVYINGFTQGDEAIASQLAFVADRCEADAACTDALGDIRAQIETFVADREPGLVDDFIAQVSRLNRHGAAPLLVSTLSAATDEDAQALLDTLDGYDYVELGDRDYGDLIRDDIAERAESFPMTLAIVCAEEAAYIDAQPSEVEVYGWSDAVLATFEGMEGGAPFPPDVATLICDAFGAPAAPELEIMPVQSDIPTLILSGGQDVQTPVAWADEVLGNLSNAEHYVMPLGEHVTSTGNGCARDLVLAFFDDPGAPLDASCLDDYPTELVLDSRDLAATFEPG